MQVIKRLVLSGLLYAILALASNAHAVLTIEITGGTEGAIPIAVVPFGWQAMEANAPVDIASVVSNDLSRSGTFKSLPERDMLSKPTDPSAVKFRNWQALGQEYLVIGQIRSAGAGRYTVQFELFDVFKGEQLTGYSFASSGGDMRRIAHRISDIIYEKLTGLPGAFGTRIAYVTSQPSAGNKRMYKLVVADADGYGPKTIAASEEPLMSPAWSPDGQKLAYVSFEKKASAIYIQTVATGQRTRVAAYRGINGAPAWSPDGRQLAMTLSKDGSPDIFVKDLVSGSLRKLTQNYAIDTEPAWSRDGRNIVFTSDRGGKPQLYMVSAGGGAARRLTFEGDYNTRGVFSPDGKTLAMVHGNGGDYRIAVLDLATRSLNVLTKGRLDESPSFAPNGSMILYASRRGNKGHLAAVSADGRVHENLVLDIGEVREPAWSPL
ncbi:MAG: Tol-Pal system beta propeller repeat protein TolB [Pseudomonadota bacterium]